MFEEESKEYASTSGLSNNTSFFDVKAMSFKDGAEFGYNKANEWHYVKDGKYPTHENKVLCILGDFENDNLEVGYYSQVEGDSKRWRFNDYDLPDDSEEDWGVSAWKEIVLPELKENE